MWHISKEHVSLHYTLTWRTFLPGLSKKKIIYFTSSSNSSSKHRKLRNHNKVLSLSLNSDKLRLFASVSNGPRAQEPPVSGFSCTEKAAYSPLLLCRMESNFDVSSGCFTKFKWWDEKHCKQVDENTSVWLFCDSRWEKLSWQNQDYSQCHTSSTRLSTGPERGWRGQLFNWWCAGFIPVLKKRGLGWKYHTVVFSGGISLVIKWKKVKSLSHVQLFATPWTIAHQALLSMGFSRQEYWSGLPCLPLGYLSNPEIKSGSPTLQVDTLPSEPPESPPGYNFKQVSLNQNLFHPQFFTPWIWVIFVLP